MITLKADKNRDIFVNESGDFVFLADKEAVSEVSEAYIRTARNEMIHKMNKGMPYFESIFAGVASIPQFEASFRARMREIEEVRAVTQFKAYFDDGVIKYDAIIQTINGEVRLSNV